jgi:hypothetical protein
VGCSNGYDHFEVSSHPLSARLNSFQGRSAFDFSDAIYRFTASSRTSVG